MKNILAFLLLLCWLISSCQPAPKPINYGSDSCSFCKMSIVDQQHAAEMVTAKGKVFKYDAIECMVNAVHEKKKKDFAFLLVNDYANPAELVDAKTSHFLISKNIPSPMGAYLSAFSNKAIASDTRQQKGGELYTWNELQTLLKKQ